MTGAAGFIGSHLVDQLLAKASVEEVLAIDCLSYAGVLANLAEAGLDPAKLSSSSPRLSFAKADCRDPVAMEKLFLDFKPDWVFHLAAESHVDRSISSPLEACSTNFLGTASVLEASRKLYEKLSLEAKAKFRHVHVSTDEVFGSLGPEDLPFCETTRYQPRSPYSASKAGSDHLAKAWFHTYGLPATVTNCSNNYGPRQFPEKLIPRSILALLAGEEIEIYGDGSNVRDWIYVADHAAGLIAAAERGKPGETYCFGASSEKTNLEIAAAIAEAMDKLRPLPSGSYSSRVKLVRDRPGHDFRYAIDPWKAQSQLEWKPSRSFSQAIAETVEWYLASEAWWKPLQAKYSGQRLS